MSEKFTFEHLRFDTISSAFQHQLNGIQKGESRYLKHYTRSYPMVRNILKNIYGAGVFSVTMHDYKCKVTCKREIGDLSGYYLRHMQSVKELKTTLVMFDCEAITHTYVDVTELGVLCNSEKINLPKTMKLSNCMRELGYSKSQRRIKINSRLHYFWYKPAFIDEYDVIKKIRHYHNNYF